MYNWLSVRDSGNDQVSRCTIGLVYEMAIQMYNWLSVRDCTIGNGQASSDVQLA